MDNVVYTLGVWQVMPGQEAKFIVAWEPLRDVFSNLEHPPIKVTVIQNMSDPTRFYSFAPWKRLEDIEEMRSDPNAQAAIRDLMDLCTEATPGTFRVAQSWSQSTEIS